MPAFANPFGGNIDRKLTKDELMQALRVDVASELEAIFLYEAHAAATDDPVVKKVLKDIADEEREHIGELTALIRYLEPDVDGFLTEGMGEVREMMEELGIKEAVITQSTNSQLREEEKKDDDDDKKSGKSSAKKSK